MSTEQSNKIHFKEVALIVLSAFIGALFPFILGLIWPDKELNTVSSIINSPTVINNVSVKNNNVQRYHAPKERQRPAVNDKQIAADTYVDIYLNINSNDVVLLNGKPASGDELSAVPNTLKLILGRRYVIKINNCPEKQIIAAKDMTVSVCM